MTTWEEDQERDAPINAVQSEMLGFCTCGDPSASLRYVRDGLRLIDDGMKSPYSLMSHSVEAVADHDAWYKDHKARCNKHFGSEEAEYFFYYWACKEDLTTHGGSVPGWLEQKGKDLLAALDALGDTIDAEVCCD